MSREPTDAIDVADVARTAIETLVFAPIGLGAKIVDDAPDVVRRVRQELRNARFIGRLTVERGGAWRQYRAAEDSDRPTDQPAESESAGDSDPEGLAIPGYDEMPAIEIVELLDTLTPAQRAAIADHETAHRRRRTVLGKIAQLAE